MGKGLWGMGAGWENQENPRVTRDIPYLSLFQYRFYWGNVYVIQTQLAVGPLLTSQSPNWQPCPRHLY